MPQNLPSQPITIPLLPRIYSPFLVILQHTCMAARKMFIARKWRRIFCSGKAYVKRGGADAFGMTWEDALQQDGSVTHGQALPVLKPVLAGNCTDLEKRMMWYLINHGIGCTNGY